MASNRRGPRDVTLASGIYLTVLHEVATSEDLEVRAPRAIPLATTLDELLLRVILTYRQRCDNERAIRPGFNRSHFFDHIGTFCVQLATQVLEGADTLELAAQVAIPMLGYEGLQLNGSDAVVACVRRVRTVRLDTTNAAQLIARRTRRRWRYVPWARDDQRPNDPFQDSRAWAQAHLPIGTEEQVRREFIRLWGME